MWFLLTTADPYCKMMLSSFYLLFLIPLWILLTTGEKIYVRKVKDELALYVYDDVQVDTFNGSIKWCKNLGGQLPTVHSSEDLDFLADTVIQKNSHHNSDVAYKTWLYMTRSGGHCKWVDGSPDYTLFNWFKKCLDNDQCRGGCCAIVMSNQDNLKPDDDEEEDLHKKVSPILCNNYARKVCIVRTRIEDFGKKMSVIQERLGSSSILSAVNVTSDQSTPIFLMLMNEIASQNTAYETAVVVLSLLLVISFVFFAVLVCFWSRYGGRREACPMSFQSIYYHRADPDTSQDILLE